MSRRFAKNLNAQCWLWKDHTGWREAARITELAAKHRPHFIAKCGNTYSSEWWWSKLWHCLRTDQAVFDAAFSWVEAADWVPAALAGNTDPLVLSRGVCAAGHKAMYNIEWGGLPDREFLSALDPALGEGTAASFAVDPRLLDLLRRQLAARSIYRDGLPLDRARTELRARFP